LGEPLTGETPRTLTKLWQAVFWVSFPFGILSFVLSVYSKEPGASALQVGAPFSALSSQGV
jgi:hypothetical protein